MSGCTPAPERLPPADGETGDWFYRSGDRDRGPMTLSQLRDLVGSSGEVAGEIVVRQGSAGEWVPYESIDSAAARRLHARGSTQTSDAAASRGAGSSPAAPAISASPRLNRKPSLSQHFRDDRQIALGVLVWIALNVVLWTVLDPLQSTERRYFEMISDAAKTARNLRKQGLDSPARGRAAKSVLQGLQPMIADLKKSAGPSQPICQHLLWAAKDQLPQLFTANGKKLDECDGIFQRHMYEAGRRLGYDVPLPPTSVVVP